MFKWAGRIFFIGLLVFVGFSVATYFMSKPNSPPSVADAPYVIQTYSNDEFKFPSRYYLAKEVVIRDDGTPVINTYWSYNGKRYTKHSGDLVFDKNLYGSIDIRRRK